MVKRTTVIKVLKSLEGFGTFFDISDKDYSDEKLPLSVFQEDKMISFDSDIYVLLNDGFNPFHYMTTSEIKEYGIQNIKSLDPQGDNFCHALEKRYPSLVFEYYNNSMIQWTKRS